jgi:uncharacterized protein
VELQALAQRPRQRCDRCDLAAAESDAPVAVESSEAPKAESVERVQVKAAPAKPRPAKPPVKTRINSVEEAIDGALHILGERISENPEFRKQLRDKLMLEGIVRASVIPGRESEKTKYEMYYKFEETVPKIPSHASLRFVASEKYSHQHRDGFRFIE